MAYLHCHNCGWSQDDFYDEGYNPAKYLMGWNEYLFGSKSYKFDDQFTDDERFIKERGNLTTREVLAQEYENFAKKIREMKWVTYEDYVYDKNKGIAKCPNCGSSKDLDID